MLESSIPLGRVLGIRVGVHYTWFIIFALVSFTLSRHFHELHPDWGVGTIWLTALATALLFFASILLHELGDSVVAIRRGIPVHSITLFIFGGMAQTKKDSDTARTEFWVAIAGPLVSLALAGLFYLLGLLVAGSDPVRRDMATRLKSSGFAVVAASTPEEALEKIERVSPTIIVTETQFPGRAVSGVMFLQLLRANSKFSFVPVLLVCDAQEAVTLTSSELREIEGVVKTPVDFDELNAVINEKLSKLRNYISNM